jgi:hypothetical protein
MTKFLSGPWECSQVYCQPFQTDAFSYTVGTAGSIQFSAQLKDFSPEAQVLLTKANQKYHLKAGFFWYQR